MERGKIIGLCGVIFFGFCFALGAWLFVLTLRMLRKVPSFLGHSWEWLGVEKNRRFAVTCTVIVPFLGMALYRIFAH